MTLIEIRPHRWGWSVFEAHGVEPVFPEKHNDLFATRGAQVPADLINRDVTQPNGPDERVQKAVFHDFWAIRHEL